jgi:hypothetical protein
MESGLITSLEQGACSGSVISAQYANESDNSNPSITCGGLAGLPSKEFKGYISANDPDGDALNWSIDTGGTTWTGWSAAPILRSTANLSQKEIYASSAGSNGNYNFSVTVTDNRGGSASKSCSINISSSGPVVYPITDKQVVIGKNLDFTINASDPGENYPLTFSLNPSLTCTSNGDRGCRVNQIVGSSFPATTPGGTDYIISARAINSLGVFSPAQVFNLKVINNKPIIAKPLNCNSSVRISNSYNCDINATDPDGHDITYIFSGLPSGMSGDSSTGVISGSPSVAGEYTIRVKVKDQYNAESSEESFVLAVNTYCGDNIRQEINDEGKVEECDGNDKAGENCMTVYPGQFTGGILNCSSDCKFNDSQCVNTFNISGNVKDYMTALPLSGVTVEAKDQSSNVVKSAVTGADGNYLLSDVPALINYNVIASKTGYSNGDSGIFSLNGDKVFNFNIAGAGLQGAARFQLTWGASPSDLDSHLKFNSIHISYLNKIEGGSSLDKDDINSYGPENIRIETLISGATYKYFIYDYTHRSNCGSGNFNEAKVEIYNSGGVKVKEYISSHTGDCYWYVFDMDDTGRIIDKNIYQNTEP